MGACLNCFRQPQAEGLGTAATSQWPLLTWFKKRTNTEKLRICGIAISCLETILLVIVISTVSWIKRFVRGIFVFQGLWHECFLGNCVYLTDRPNYIYISIFFMLLSAATSYGSVVTGILCLTSIQPPKWLTTTWPTLTIGLCFLSGFNGAMGLFHYMRAATEVPHTFLSWSLAPGWLSVILATMAGVCHLVVKKWEKDEDTTELLAGMPMKTLKEDLLLNPVSQSALKRPRAGTSKSVTAL